MKPLALLFLLSFSTLAWATPQQDFTKHMQAKNYDGALEALVKWQAGEPNNAEVVVGFVNLYFMKSMSSGVSIDSVPKPQAGQENQLTVQDPKTGKNFYINEKTLYDQKEIENAMRYFELGIREFPNRLDIRFGQIYVLNTIEDYTRASKALVETLKAAAANNGRWLWSNNTDYGRSAEEFLTDVQDYYGLWYSSGTTAGMEALKTGSLQQIESFPRHSWAFDNLALYYSSVKDGDNQLKMLLKAHDLEPGDPVNLNNIAYFYLKQGQNALAREYYQKVIDLNLDDPKFAEQARKMLASLGD